MQILIIGGPILVGFVAGYFLSQMMLVVLTCLAAVMGYVMWPQKHSGLASIPGILYLFGAIVGVSTMWITYYIVTKQTWLGDLLLQAPILRQ